MQTRDQPKVRPPLTRPREGRRVAGVAAGIAAWFGVDPNVVRLAFGVLVFANGIGLVLYAVGWLVLPEEGEPVSRLQRIVRPSGRWDIVAIAALAAVVIPTLVLARQLGVGVPSSVLGPLIIAGIGGALVWGRLRPDDGAMDGGAMDPSASPSSAAVTASARWDPGTGRRVPRGRRIDPRHRRRERLPGREHDRDRGAARR